MFYFFFLFHHIKIRYISGMQFKLKFINIPVLYAGFIIILTDKLLIYINYLFKRKLVK